jgi:hypothetical protein
MAKGDIELPKNPTPPPSPTKRVARITIGIDRPIAGAEDAMTPREVSDLTRGPLTSVGETNKQFEKDILNRRRRLGSNRMFSRDYAKRPLTLKGGKR